MSINARPESYEHIELFGSPALFSIFRIDRDALPKGFYCYDLRGSDYDSGTPVAIAPSVKVNHAGSVLTLIPFALPTEGEIRLGEDGLNFLGEDLSLADFCKKHHYAPPLEHRNFSLRPAAISEKYMFYAMPASEDSAMGVIGHVRMDFGRHGTEFFTTWFQRGPENRNNAEFKAELEVLVNELRESGPLKNCITMYHFCREHGGCLDLPVGNNYGYIIQTENYRYYLRCNPTLGDYNAYLTAFKLPDLRLYEETLRVTLPDGRQLRARVDGDTKFPCIQVLVAADANTPQIEEHLAACLEYNPEFGPNQDCTVLGVTAYMKNDDEPAYYAEF